jgi:hypothetical protein
MAAATFANLEVISLLGRHPSANLHAKDQVTIICSCVISSELDVVIHTFFFFFFFFLSSPPPPKKIKIKIKNKIILK